MEKPLKRITTGVEFAALCFPPWEWSNWKWGREFPEQMFAVGPMRFKCARTFAWR